MEARIRFGYYASQGVWIVLKTGTGITLRICGYSRDCMSLDILWDGPTTLQGMEQGVKLLRKVCKKYERYLDLGMGRESCFAALAFEALKLEEIPRVTVEAGLSLEKRQIEFADSRITSPRELVSRLYRHMEKWEEQVRVENAAEDTAAEAHLMGERDNENTEVSV